MAGRKYKIHEKAPERPFKCIVSNLAGPVVDLETYVKDYGRVYLHVNIVAALAAQHGFITKKEADQLREDAAAAREEADRWPAVLKEFDENVRDALVRASAAAVGGGDPVGGGDDSGDAAAGGLAGGDDADAAAAGAGDGPSGGEDTAGLRASADVSFDQPAVPSE